MLLPFTFNATARGLITLYASALLAGMWSMMVPAVPVMATAFAVSPGTAAQTITALALGRFAGMPLSGAVLDRLGTRAALTAGPALACGAALLAGITPWFSLILALLFLIGVGESIWVIAREVAGIDLTRQDQRGRVLSGFHGINNLGLALGPLFGGLLTEAVGFRAVFFGYAACAVTSVFLGLAVGAAPTPPPAPSAGVADWGFAALGQRLRGLKDLFEQISPGPAHHLYRAGPSYFHELHAPGHDSKHAAAARHGENGIVAERNRHAVYDLGVFGFRHDPPRGLCHR